MSATRNSPGGTSGCVRPGWGSQHAYVCLSGVRHVVTELSGFVLVSHRGQGDDLTSTLILVPHNRTVHGAAVARNVVPISFARGDLSRFDHDDALSCQVEVGGAGGMDAGDAEWGVK